MLINLSNHPSSKWSLEQIRTAKKVYVRIMDLKFPDISPNTELIEVMKESAKYLIEIMNIFAHHSEENNAVHIMGEFTFTFNLLEILKQNNISAVASTTSREVYEDKKGNKVSKFNFIRFRNYY